MQAAIAARGFGAITVVELPGSTRTAADAAESIGCTVAQIAKSLVFEGKTSGDPILVIASGTNRVNTQTIEQIVGEAIKKPDADFVREKTGFVIGGVPPVGHAQPLKTLIDEDLRQYDTIWAAAGTPRAVFKLTPSDLEALTGGRVISIG